MRKLFAITIGQDAQGYCVNIVSMTDNKVCQIVSVSLRTAVVRLNKLLRDKAKEVRNFPLPESSLIVLDDSSQRKIIAAKAGQFANGNG